MNPPWKWQVAGVYELSLIGIPAINPPLRYNGIDNEGSLGVSKGIDILKFAES